MLYAIHKHHHYLHVSALFITSNLLPKLAFLHNFGYKHAFVPIAKN